MRIGMRALAFATHTDDRDSILESIAKRFSFLGYQKFAYFRTVRLDGAKGDALSAWGGPR
ncbi:hypothetical protein BRPE64_CCDS08000 [Caballeronia insecticola]|uniref:Uncharacterized protein n=1 Tax=Caballeronia insecticola TaxID=758793 RepID=R4WQC1_9BURK|nr:hypothetical protein BRPE64_CCDS08000 [Caballeronia insecticola]